jgi:hypothetical protein
MWGQQDIDSLLADEQEIERETAQEQEVMEQQAADEMGQLHEEANMEMGAHAAPAPPSDTALPVVAPQGFEARQCTLPFLARPPAGNEMPLHLVCRRLFVKQPMPPAYVARFAKQQAALHAKAALQQGICDSAIAAEAWTEVTALSEDAQRKLSEDAQRPP